MPRLSRGSGAFVSAATMLPRVAVHDWLLVSQGKLVAAYTFRRNRVSKPDPSKEGPVSKGTGLYLFKFSEGVPMNDIEKLDNVTWYGHCVIHVMAAINDLPNEAKLIFCQDLERFVRRQQRTLRDAVT